MHLSPAPLTAVFVALPFLWAYTDAPTANFWPVLVSWTCGGALLALAAAQPRRDWSRLSWAQLTAVGLVLAAVLSSVVALLQYFGGDPGLAPFIHASTPGQAVGNLRQRNQQASLLSLGLWALLWCVLHGQQRSSGQGKAVRWAGVLAAAAIAWLALAQAATASRTGALQWVLILGLLVCWRRTGRGAPLHLAMAALLAYLLAAWTLPELLWQVQGVRSDGLFARLAGDAQACTSRRALWSNMLTLIAQRPWLGWGWGELDYAHYITLFPGVRFCVLLDNAHNLPLHLAVELGVPTALVLCGGVFAWVLYRRPWAEVRPARQLAWGILAIVGLHSLLEYPLWYGPFQIIVLAALALLLWPRRLHAGMRAPRIVGMAAAGLIWASCAYAAWDYHRVSQLYRPYEERAAAYREDTQAKVGSSLLFARQVAFARLTTMAPTRENAARMKALAQELLHYSPEPRVIQALIESAVMLGDDAQAAFHMRRYRIAYPREYARWIGARASAPEPSQQ